MHSIVTTFRGADTKVEVVNFCAAMDTLIGQDAYAVVIVDVWHGLFQMLRKYKNDIPKLVP